MKKFIKVFRSEESGQGVVEYALILAMIVLAVITGLTILGETTNDLFEEAVNKIP